MKLAVFGASGFVGSYFVNKSIKYEFVLFNRENIHDFSLYTHDRDIKVVLNFVGKAHDLKKISDRKEYYEINTNFCVDLFNSFLNSDAKVFITLSSVKAVADKVEGELTEEYTPIPLSHYGKSKLLAEQYILSQTIPDGKRVYILRPCMIHGPGNKGNLNILYKLVSKGFPWPLGEFKNRRSFLSIENLYFIISELIDRDDIPSGIYNLADDIPLSTNEVIRLIAKSKNKKVRVLSISKLFITAIAYLGNVLKLSINTERLHKLTENYVVSNNKIKKALGKPLPISSTEGLLITFNSFSNDS